MEKVFLLKVKLAIANLSVSNIVHCNFSSGWRNFRTFRLHDIYCHLRLLCLKQRLSLRFIRVVLCFFSQNLNLNTSAVFFSFYSAEDDAQMLSDHPANLILMAFANFWGENDAFPHRSSDRFCIYQDTFLLKKQPTNVAQIILVILFTLSLFDVLLVLFFFLWFFLQGNICSHTTWIPDWQVHTRCSSWKIRQMAVQLPLRKVSISRSGIYQKLCTIFISLKGVFKLLTSRSDT